MTTTCSTYLSDIWIFVLNYSVIWWSMYIVCGWILDTEVSLSISTVCTDGEYSDRLKTSVCSYTTGRAQKYAISFIASSLRCYCCMLFFSLSQVHMYTHVFSIFIKWFFFLHTFFFFINQDIKCQSYFCYLGCCY